MRLTTLVKATRSARFVDISETFIMVVVHFLFFASIFIVAAENKFYAPVSK